MKRFLIIPLLIASAFGQTPKIKINNGQLTTDFDLNQKQLLNWSPSQTFPPINPPALSIVDSMVSNTAAIAQNKLALTGAIPPSFLGTTSTTAAEGDLAEYVSHKAQANGYASLDSGGKIPVGQLPASAGTGTVTTVGPSSISLAPLGSLSVTNQTTTPAFAYTQSNVAANSWYGNATGSSAAPAFNTTALPVGLIPNLTGTQITTGTVATARLATSVQRLVAASVSLSGSTPAIDWSATTVFYWTLGANSTPTFSNSTDTWSIVVSVTNTSTYTVTWPNTIKWIGGSQPVQTTGAHTDLWGFQNVNGTVSGAILQNY